MMKPEDLRVYTERGQKFMNKMKNWFKEGAGTVISLYDCFLAYFKK